MKPLDHRSVFSRNLVRFRKAKSLTQEKLAELAGITRRQLTHYELLATDPSVSILIRLSKILEVSINDLVEDQPERPVEGPPPVDPRTFRKALEIAELSKEDRGLIYGMINKLRKLSKYQSSATEDQSVAEAQKEYDDDKD